MHAVKTLDAHAAGGPLRLIIDGMPTPRGRTLRARAEWMAKHADHLRRALVLEPRGHHDLVAAMLTEPVSDEAHAGVLFMHASGYTPLSGHGLIAITTLALERGLVVPGGDDRTIVFDTAAGRVVARATPGGPGRVTHVDVELVPSFVMRAGLRVSVGDRQVRADVAFAGRLLAVVDAESVGLGVEPEHVPALRRLGPLVAAAVAEATAIEHPINGRRAGVDGTVFTAPAHAEDAHLRTVTVLAGGEVGRSPSGTGTAAVMAVLDAMGLLDDRVFEAEGLLGHRFSGRIVGRTSIGEMAAVVPEVRGSAWCVGESSLLMDDTDPLAHGASV